MRNEKRGRGFSSSRSEEPRILLPCLFKPNDVFCSYRKHEHLAVMPRCLECRFYLEFAKDQEDFEEEVFREAERLWRDESDG